MKPLVVANWKMNLNLSDALVLSGQFANLAEKYRNLSLVLAPPSLFIFPVKDHLKAKSANFHLALQDVFYEKSGEFTGEISAEMVKGVCDYSIIGHSERRKYFGETDEIIERKLQVLLKADMKAIVCVGEEERYHLEDHFDYEVKRMKKSGGLLDSVEKILHNAKLADLDDIVIAYEPVWVIGTGNAASGAYAAAVCYIIKSFLKEKFLQAADKIQIIYGGSSCAENAKEFMSQPNIDGLLVGSASLSAKEFKRICQTSSEAYQNGK